MKYELHINSSNIIGMGLVEKVVEMANLGATIKEDTIPSLKFPFQVRMVLDSEVEPDATPEMRVFREDKTEVFIKKIEAVKVEQPDGSFSMEVDPALATNDKGEYRTKEELEALSWNELKIVCKALDITGRDKTLMIRQYLEKAAESQE